MPEIVTPPPPPRILPECDVPPPAAGELKMRLPFGLNIQAIQDSFLRHMDADDAIMKFIAQIQPALSPFMSVLVLAALAKAFYDFSKAAKEAVTSLSPDPIIEAIEKIVVLLPKLLEFIPPLNYIPPVIDLVVLVLTLLDAAISALITVLETEILKNAFEEALRKNQLLGEFQECLDAGIELQKRGFAGSMVATAPIMCILAQLLDLLDFEPIKKYIQPLRDIVAALNGVTADDVNPDLADFLIEVQDFLREIRQALEPFIGPVKNAC